MLKKKRVPALGIAACLFSLALVGLAVAQGGVRVSGGYTAGAFSDAYVMDATKAAKNAFSRFLENAAPRAKFDAVPFESTEEMIRALKERRIDMVGGPPNQIIEIAKAVPIEPALVSEGLSNFFHDAVLLVPRDSGIETLKDLEGKTLMVLEGADGGHVRLWLDTWVLRESGRTTEAYFGMIKRGRNGSQTTLGCFFHQADACLVPRGTFDLAVAANRQVGEKLKSIGASQNLPGAILAFRAGLSPADKAQILEIVLHVQDDVFGQRVLKLFHQKRFVRFKPQHLAAAEALVREHADLMKAVQSTKRP
ncbi:MAG: PhnD/SsuA/transferrin family substrate-binding protein [Vicinamibacteria bacterium]